MFNKIKLGFFLGLVSIGISFSSLAFMPTAQAAQGLYSMKALLDAPVYAEGYSKSIGEVENVIVDDHMKITGIVIEVDDSSSKMDGKKVFVQTGLFHLKTEQDSHLDTVRYRIDLDKSVAAITDYPVVDDGWWNSAKLAATAVWNKTKSTAKSAWDATKDATKNVLDSIHEKMQ